MITRRLVPFVGLFLIAVSGVIMAVWPDSDDDDGFMDYIRIIVLAAPLGFGVACLARTR